MAVALTLLSSVRWRGAEITGSRPRDLVALLAADLPTGCGNARLIDALWPGARPEHPTKALQTVVSRTRAMLGADVIVSTPTGYRLALSPEQLDTTAAVRHAAASRRCARDGDHRAALRHADAGLELFAATDADDAAPDSPVRMLRAGLEATRWELIRARALALSRTGRHDEAVAPLAGLAHRHPRDEELLAELLRCEAATSGAATALTRYDTFRRALREEHGTGPGPGLQEIHRELLLLDTPAVRRGVRHEPNALLGRDGDIGAVTALLRDSRVVSIVGAGGLGKTRVAFAVAGQASHRTVNVVELAGVTADGDVIAEVASVVEAGENRPGAAPGAVDRIAEALGPGPALLVLDNCEHVLDGVAGLVQSLVSAGRDLRVLTTSRAPLGLSSEHVYPLPQLDPPTMADLFRRRARAVRPDADLPDGAVTALCARLDGLPLAAELAAARVRVMSVAEISRRLDDRFTLLRAGLRDAPRRHRTLQAVIEWSWDLLDDDGRAAMRALSVFPGGFTVDAARHLIGDDTILDQLAEQSLLKVTDDGPRARLHMLETVREFSTARRREAGEDERTVTRFLGWARDLGAGGPDPVLTADLLPDLARVRAEQDNLVQALRYGLDRGDGDVVAVTAAMLGSLWLTESNFTRLTALARDAPPVLSRTRPGPGTVEAARTAAVLCAVSAYLLRGPAPLRALAVLRRMPVPAADTVVRAAQVALCAPGPQALRELCDSDQPLVAGTAGYAYSFVAEHGNDLPGALRAARRMLAGIGDDGDPWIRAVAHARIGELCLQVEPGQPAFDHLNEALRLMRQLGAAPTVARGRWALLLADLQRGEYDRAERGLEQITGAGDKPTGLPLFDVCARAEIRLGRGDVDGGLRLWREAAGRLRDDPAGAASWACEVQVVAVVTHAHHGRLDLVRDLTGTLTESAATTVGAAPVVEFPVCGSLLLVPALVDLDRGAASRAVRMIALAERFRWLSGFQPTMSGARIRELAEQADKAAYAVAVTEYAGLDHDGLRAAALAQLIRRDRG
ncbi:BTAD domain-containing putative transcriptional regulator [Actinoplanes sp. NPDC049802]|uniref:ATP-binding protein n=1 Tax=Actinoplanes sp. NPDC049802 TaxID=3154742 RepID=UPI0033E04824